MKEAGVAAKLMGFDPLAVPYLRMCDDEGLGTARPQEIELVGEPAYSVLGVGNPILMSLGKLPVRLNPAPLAPEQRRGLA